MLIIPAIDLQDGCVVRLVQGRLDKKVYSRDPVKTARHWTKQGAELLHLVDLDGAISGTIRNLKAVKEVVKNAGVPVQFGGGARKLETIRALLGLGVWRVVLGTKAIEDRAFLARAFKLFGNRIIVGIDAKDNNLLTKGWRSCEKGKDILTFANRLKKIGFRELIYTDTLKDGTLRGPNIKGVRKLLKQTGMRIIASGGVSCLDDIRRLKALEKEGLAGVIIGKALYEGKFTLTQALKLG